ncbi:MAG TPA: HAD family hydrolase [Amycolatopsis sp.]|uniref:HAD family hydrolase n=1 Tax=Amycolatopsis sp. TaxID=37632 RepID=UPI002B4A73D5|nr:HAD family hydrolase [Amycolatopsis sp.]HKS43540.1 HAD family hydrolase [Amycolatopsis sp.]
MRHTEQVLVFDADDTLWENNVVFERVIDDYLDWLAHPTLGKTELRAVLDHVERANSAVHGYGTRIFLRSLRECFEKLRERPATEPERREILALADALINHRVELIPGVAETLDELRGRHHLLLLTKGDTEEQQRKIDASGLAGHFESVHIVPEKHAGIYLRLVGQHGWTPTDAWMIGNSPASDIQPARQAGMNAVFIPNDNTWTLEGCELDPADNRVLRLDRFPDLLRHF